MSRPFFSKANSPASLASFLESTFASPFLNSVLEYLGIISPQDYGEVYI